MGFSIAIIAFALDDAQRVLDGFSWSETTQQVGVPVDMATLSIGDLLNPERQAANNPHFSAARGKKHFFVYTSLKESKPGIYPDFALISQTAPLTAYIVVETSNASGVERWEGGDVIWSVGGGDGYEYDITGNPPIDLNAMADGYRVWWNSLPHDLEFSEPGEFDLPDDNDALIVARFSSILDNWFATETGFRYAGDHPALFRLTGELPVRDIREQRRD